MQTLTALCFFEEIHSRTKLMQCLPVAKPWLSLAAREERESAEKAKEVHRLIWEYRHG